MRALPSNTCWGGRSTPDPAGCGHRDAKNQLFSRRNLGCATVPGQPAKLAACAQSAQGQAEASRKMSELIFSAGLCLSFARELAWRFSKSQAHMVCYLAIVGSQGWVQGPMGPGSGVRGPKRPPAYSLWFYSSPVRSSSISMQYQVSPSTGKSVFFAPGVSRKPAAR